MHIIDSISITSYVAGKLTNNHSQGTSLQNSIYIASRTFLPFVLLILAFLIENGATFKEFMLYSILHLLPMIFIIIAVILNINFFQKFFQKVIFNRKSETLPKAVFHGIFLRNHEQELIEFLVEFSINRVVLLKSLLSSLAYIFLTTGFFISFSFAFYFEEFRMTVSQLTTVFHGFGTLILAIAIDPMLSKSIDNSADSDYWIINIFSIIFGRLLAYFIVFCTFLLIYLLIEV